MSECFCVGVGAPAVLTLFSLLSEAVCCGLIVTPCQKVASPLCGGCILPPELDEGQDWGGVPRRGQQSQKRCRVAPERPL